MSRRPTSQNCRLAAGSSKCSPTDTIAIPRDEICTAVPRSPQPDILVHDIQIEFRDAGPGQLQMLARFHIFDDALVHRFIRNDPTWRRGCWPVGLTLLFDDLWEEKDREGSPGRPDRQPWSVAHDHCMGATAEIGGASTGPGRDQRERFAPAKPGALRERARWGAQEGGPNRGSSLGRPCGERPASEADAKKGRESARLTLAPQLTPSTASDWLPSFSPVNESAARIHSDAFCPPDRCL